jgi:flagellar hook protein FlgE
MFSIIKAGMATAKHELSVISNNVANANTNGFKKSMASYADLAPSSLSDSIAASSSGLGSLIEDTRISHSQSTLVETDKKTDFGLAGNGFFVLRNPTDMSISYTRNGRFGLDENGFLTTSDNCLVLGQPSIEGEFSVEDMDVESLLPIQIPASKAEVQMTELQIEEDGKITAVYGDETYDKLSTLALGLFTNPDSLRELGNSRYAATKNAGALKLGRPSDTGYANLKSGWLEASNVDITDELTAMIKAQQQFNGAARLMQTNSELLEKLTR